MQEAIAHIGLRGERVSFAGRMEGFSRGRSAEAVRAAGGEYNPSVNKETTVLVVGGLGWDMSQVPRNLKLAERLNLEGRGPRIISEEEFREMIGLAEPSPLDQRGATLERTQAAAGVGVGVDVLKQWEYLGLVRSRDGRFDFQDVIAIRAIRELVDQGLDARAIQQGLRSMKKVLPRHIERPLSQLRFQVSEGRLVAEFEEALLDEHGQLEMSFQGPASESEQSPRLQLEETKSAQKNALEVWLHLGREAEAAGDDAQAVSAYERASALAPADPRAQFNIGNVHLAAQRYAVAIHHFARALSVDPQHARSWFNLAHAQDALGRAGEAISSLRRAVGADPFFADAHFNLADLAQRMGKHDLARKSWTEYLRLDPAGGWAAEARRRLTQLRATGGQST